MRILGIESSCDETGIAIYDEQLGLMSHILYSQIDTHQRYGGVVPELASRDHIKHIPILVNEALHKAQVTKNTLSAIAYTAGPGLIGALLTGASFAKSLAFALDIPAIAIHHLEAHILAAKLSCPELEFPFTALLVSGGHTQLIEARALGNYHLLGDTLDDAVGEAFDKTAKLMGIAYPGGPKLAKLADEAQEVAIPIIPAFPRPMTDRPGLDFSFSGLKTHALNIWNKSTKDHVAQVAIASAFQSAIVDTLVIKCKRALEQTDNQQLVVAGGVGANRALRAQLVQMTNRLNKVVYFPSTEFCTDNGAMVAYAGYLHALAKQKDSSLAIDVKARWPLMTLNHETF